MIEVKDGTGVRNFTYDANGRLIKVTSSDGTEINYTYDSVGNRTSITYKVGNITRTIQYEYNGRNQITKIIDPDGNQTTFTYDGVGNLIKKVLPNGVVINYSYDSRDRVSQISVSGIGNFVYSYDNVGNVISEVSPQGTINYTYDNIYQLTQADYSDGTTYTYSYDGAGNRIEDKDRTYTYNNLNQLISASDGTIYSYDLNGNLIERDKNGQKTSYGWNAFDKLIEVSLSDGNVIKFIYDAEGIRKGKIVGGGEVKYLMDGLAVLCEYDEGGNIKREYVPGISMKEGENTYYYITDRLGNVRYVLNSSGSVVQSYLYSPFGEIHSSSGSLTQPYQYVGEEFYYTEGDIGLKLLGQRWYDSEVGRFISRDPIEEEGGLNLYAYVKGNPLLYTDVFGLIIINIYSYPSVQRCLEILKNCKHYFKEAIEKIGKEIYYNSELKACGLFRPGVWPWSKMRIYIGMPGLTAVAKGWTGFDQMCSTIAHELVHVWEWIHGYSITGDIAENIAIKYGEEVYEKECRPCKGKKD